MCVNHWNREYFTIALTSTISTNHHVSCTSDQPIIGWHKPNYNVRLLHHKPRYYNKLSLLDAHAQRYDDATWTIVSNSCQFCKTPNELILWEGTEYPLHSAENNNTTSTLACRNNRSASVRLFSATVEASISLTAAAILLPVEYRLHRASYNHFINSLKVRAPFSIP